MQLLVYNISENNSKGDSKFKQIPKKSTRSLA